MELISEGRVTGYVTPVVLANVDYIVTRYSSRVKSRKAVRFLRKMLDILPMDESVVDAALDSEFPDFEDAMQYYAAEKQGIDFIVTRNKKDYVRGRIRAVSAEEYMDMHEANELTGD